MKKENMRIKENITISDRINVINYIIDYYFTDGEYTPYYAGIAKIEAIALYFIDGVEFNDDDVYECVENDKELRTLVHKFCYDVANGNVAKKHNTDNRKYIDVMRFVIENVNEKLEFEKQKRIHCTDEKNRTMKDINDVMEELVELAKNIKYAAKPVIENPEFTTQAVGVLKKLNGADVLNRDTFIDIVMNLAKEQAIK